MFAASTGSHPAVELVDYGRRFCAKVKKPSLMGSYRATKMMFMIKNGSYYHVSMIYQGEILFKVLSFLWPLHICFILIYLFFSQLTFNLK
jgi:hypothetical protein